MYYGVAVRVGQRLWWLCQDEEFDSAPGGLILVPGDCGLRVCCRTREEAVGYAQEAGLTAADVQGYEL